jgi:hypothetical protein
MRVSPNGGARPLRRFLAVLDAARLRNAAPPWTLARTHVSGAAVRAIAAVSTIAVAFLTSAWIGGTPPFEGHTYDPYAESAVMHALPFDTPLPYDMSVAAAGRGPDLPYRAQWTSTLAAGEVAAEFRQHLERSPRWRLTQDAPVGDEFVTTLARVDAGGYMTHFGRLTIARDNDQTVITFDFTPIPAGLAPR